MRSLKWEIRKPGEVKTKTEKTVYDITCNNGQVRIYKILVGVDAVSN